VLKYETRSTWSLRSRSADLQKRKVGDQFDIADLEPNGLTDTNAGAAPGGMRVAAECRKRWVVAGALQMPTRVSTHPNSRVWLGDRRTTKIAVDALYRRRVFDAEIIELCVRWYISYPLM
jgi:hypothetical protein